MAAAGGVAAAALLGTLLFAWLLTQAVLYFLKRRRQRMLDAELASYAMQPWYSWMAYITDRSTRVVRDVVFMGSHHSACIGGLAYGPPLLQRQAFAAALPFICLLQRGINAFSATQTASLTEQANAGVRSFDLRVARDTTGVFQVWHTFRCRLTLSTVIGELAAFLAAHPTECFLVWVRIEDVLDDAGRDAFGALFEPLRVRGMLVPYPLTALSTTTIAAAGGRMFVFADRGMEFWLPPCHSQQPDADADTLNHDVVNAAGEHRNANGVAAGPAAAVAIGAPTGYLATAHAGGSGGADGVQASTLRHVATARVPPAPIFGNYDALTGEWPNKWDIPAVIDEVTYDLTCTDTSEGATRRTGAPHPLLPKSIALPTPTPPDWGNQATSALEQRSSAAGEAGSSIDGGAANVTAMSTLDFRIRIAPRDSALTAAQPPTTPTVANTPTSVSIPTSLTLIAPLVSPGASNVGPSTVSDTIADAEAVSPPAMNPMHTPTPLHPSSHATLLALSHVAPRAAMLQWICTPGNAQIARGILLSYILYADPPSLAKQARHLNAHLTAFVEKHAAAIRSTVLLMQCDVVHESHMRHCMSVLNPTLRIPDRHGNHALISVPAANTKGAHASDSARVDISDNVTVDVSDSHPTSLFLREPAAVAPGAALTAGVTVSTDRMQLLK